MCTLQGETRNSLGIQDMSTLKMINPIIVDPNENDLKETPDRIQKNDSNCIKTSNTRQNQRWGMKWRSQHRNENKNQLGEENYQRKAKMEWCLKWKTSKIHIKPSAGRKPHQQNGSCGRQSIRTVRQGRRRKGQWQIDENPQANAGRATGNQEKL